MSALPTLPVEVPEVDDTVDRLTMIAQDPNELFDVYRADGQPAGFTKSRVAVHRDGDWHRAIHVWIAGRGKDDEPFVLMQRRGLGKDTWPGVLDVAVGGHYRAGESLTETLRETEEEIGVRVDLGDLVPLGVRVCANESPEETIYDRELQDVFLLLDDRPLDAYRPHPAELAELIQVPLRTLMELQRGQPGAIAVRSLAPNAAAAVEKTVDSDDFVSTVDNYVLRACLAIRRVLAGDRDTLV